MRIEAELCRFSGDDRHLKRTHIDEYIECRIGRSDSLAREMTRRPCLQLRFTLRIKAHELCHGGKLLEFLRIFGFVVKGPFVFAQAENGNVCLVCRLEIFAEHIKCRGGKPVHREVTDFRQPPLLSHREGGKRRGKRGKTRVPAARDRRK